MFDMDPHDCMHCRYGFHPGEHDRVEFTAFAGAKDQLQLMANT